MGITCRLLSPKRKVQRKSHQTMHLVRVVRRMRKNLMLMRQKMTMQIWLSCFCVYMLSVMSYIARGCTLMSRLYSS